MPIFDTELLIDFHQTILHTERAFICPANKFITEAKALQCTNASIDAPKISKPQQQDADDYMYIQGKPALTIELSKKGFVTQHRSDTTCLCKCTRHNLKTQNTFLWKVSPIPNQKFTSIQPFTRAL